MHIYFQRKLHLPDPKFQILPNLKFLSFTQARREADRRRDRLAEFRKGVDRADSLLPTGRFPGDWALIHANNVLRTTGLQWNFDAEAVRRTCRTTSQQQECKTWRDQHIGIRASEVPGRQIPPAATRLCHQLSMCLCNQRGRFVKMIHQRLQKHIIVTFAAKHDKDLLLNACIILELRPRAVLAVEVLLQAGSFTLPCCKDGLGE